MQHPSIQDELPGIGLSCPPGVGHIFAFKTAQNVGFVAAPGYAQGCFGVDTTNGDWYVEGVGPNSNANWIKRMGVPGGPAPLFAAPSGSEPSSTLTQFGSSTATFPEEGNVNRQVSGAGINPGGTGTDNVLAVYSLPANAFDGLAGTNRGISITAAGSVANNVNSKRIKLYIGCTTAVVGSAVTGGTVIADTGAYTTTGAAGWEIAANVFKYGITNSNTQLALHTSAQIGSTVGAILVPTLLTMTENAAILIAVTGNAGTTATDIIFNWLEINAMN